MCLMFFRIFYVLMCVCVCLRVYMYAYMIAHWSWHKDTLPAHHTSHGWKQSNSKACKVCRMMQDGTQCTIRVLRVLCPFAVPKVKRGIVAGSGFSAWTLLSGYEREASQEPRSAGMPQEPLISELQGGEASDAFLTVHEWVLTGLRAAEGARIRSKCLPQRQELMFAIVKLSELIVWSVETMGFGWATQQGNHNWLLKLWGQFHFEFEMLWHGSRASSWGSAGTNGPLPHATATGSSQQGQEWVEIREIKWTTDDR